MGIPPIPLSKNCCQRLSVKAGNLIDTTTKPSLCEPSLCCDAVSITPPPEKLLAPATTVKITLRDLKINPRLSQLIKHELGLPISLPIDQFIPLNGFDAAYSENQAPLYGKGAPINSAKKVKDPQKAKEYAYKIARKLGFSREAIRKMPPSQLALLCFRIIAGQLEYDFPAYDRYKQTGQIAIP
ncbi:MAG: hypothetical protein FJZ04_04535, partial [Candidatus Moranbacteria bacterium]|nr:hypothetical protein [Candidatus Moranbacteria bacterium]